MNGYAHRDYAAALAEFGRPRSLKHCGGWVLERPIAGTTYSDAMGCYPLFACLDWNQLHADLNELQSDLVSLVFVADPFGEYESGYLRDCFPETVLPFKEHLVTDLSRSREDFVDPTHRRKARKALERLNVERCPKPTLFTDDWIRLYANLVERHSIKGLAAFSANSFKQQLNVPGMVMLRATHGEETVGINLWYVDRGVSYYHLGAYSEAGYDLGASFALFWQAIESFANQGLQWLNLGAGAGLVGNAVGDGLSRFKRGWATGSRTAYLCGRIFDQLRYDEIRKTMQVGNSDYFPAYREGEFG